MGFRMPKLEVAGDDARNKHLENDDLLPVPNERRTWGFATYLIFWMSANSTVANWLQGGTFLTLGLNVWDGTAVWVTGMLLCSCLMLANGRVGAVYHVGYPVACRASWGVYGAWWPVFNRSLSACVWNGVNTVAGGQCVYVMLHAIFPSIARVHNTMSAASALNSAQMICFFVFWLAQIPPLYLEIPKWRGLIWAKFASYILATIGILALTLTDSGGVEGVIDAPGKVTGEPRAWLLAKYFFLATASCATFVSNAADFQRNATKRTDPIAGNLVTWPISVLLNTTLGAVMAASSMKLLGVAQFNPVVYLDTLLTMHYDAKHRAAAFFIGFGFAYGLIFTCVFENLLPAGNDISSLLPKYLTIQRAMGVAMIVTVVLNPWYLLGGASIFVVFIGSYQIFLFSITGTMLVEYYIIAKGRLNLPYLYTSDREGQYWFTGGVNYRACAAYLVGIGVNFAGFLQAMGVKNIGIGVTHSYTVAWITSVVASGLTYYLLTRFFPTKTYLANKGTSFREWSPEEVEMYAAGKNRMMRPSAPDTPPNEDFDDKYNGPEVSVQPVLLEGTEKV